MIKLLKDNRYRFVLLFIVIYIMLYTANYVLTGLIQPEGIYNEWLATHFDYLTTFRLFLLGTTAKVVGLMNYDTYLTGNILYVKGGQNIRMVYSCMGINILCVWWAFVIALPILVRKKLPHFILGTICLIALNITRLSLLTISPKHISFSQVMVDHHDLYNYTVYGLMLLVIKRIIDKKIVIL